MNQYISIRSMTYVWQIVISSYYSILENKGLWSYTSKAFQIFYNEEEPIHWIKWIHFYIVIRCIISCFGPLDRSWIHTTIFMHRKLFFCSSSPLSLSASLHLSKPYNIICLTIQNEFAILRVHFTPLFALFIRWVMIKRIIIICRTCRIFAPNCATARKIKNINDLVVYYRLFCYSFYILVITILRTIFNNSFCKLNQI